MKFTKGFKRFVVICVIVGIGFLAWNIVAKPMFNRPAQPDNQPTTAQPSQPQPDATAKPGTAPTVAPVDPGQPADNTNPADTRPVITVGSDSFGSFFILMQIAQDKTLPFQVEVVPFGFNDQIGNPKEEDRGIKLYNGEYDVLLITDASLSRLGNIGEIKFFIDQSWGADKIVVKTIASNGLPIATFNDLKGKSICVADGNVNHFAILATLRVASIDPSEVTWVRFNSVPEAVDGFIAGQCDVVGAWEPEASRAVSDGNGRDFVDSAWWNNIADVAVFSYQSLAEKNDLMYSFAVAWMKYAKMQSEDLQTSGEQIAAWTYQGQPTNDWTYVYPGSEESDMHLWVDTIAQAGLVENIVTMQNLGYFKLQMVGKRDAWSRAGMIVNIAPFDVETIVNPDFVLRMANDPSLINTEEFANPKYQPIPAELPNAEVSQLLGLKTIVTLPCETFTFEPNSTVLSEQGKKEVKACAEAARDMILSSQGQILITGSSAWPAGYSEADVTNTANGRAAAVYQEFIRMGVPSSRIAVYINLPPVKDRESFDESVNSKYRFTRIEVKVYGR